MQSEHDEHVWERSTEQGGDVSQGRPGATFYRDEPVQTALVAQRGFSYSAAGPASRGLGQIKRSGKDCAQGVNYAKFETSSADPETPAHEEAMGTGRSCSCSSDVLTTNLRTCRDRVQTLGSDQSWQTDLDPGPSPNIAAWPWVECFQSSSKPNGMLSEF